MECDEDELPPLAEETCMCGCPMDSHTIGSGHTPVSMADYYRRMKADTTPARRSPKVRKVE